MNTTTEIGLPVYPHVRIVPEKGLNNAEEISIFLRREIAELQDSGEESHQVRIRVQVGKPGGRTIEERVVTLKMDEDGGRMVTVEGLLRNPITVPIKKSLVGPSQLLSDEISWTYQSERF